MDNFLNLWITHLIKPQSFKFGISNIRGGGIIQKTITVLHLNTTFLELLSLLETEGKNQTYPLVNKKQASKKGKKSEVAEKTGNIDAVTPIS